MMITLETVEANEADKKKYRELLDRVVEIRGEIGKLSEYDRKYWLSNNYLPFVHGLHTMCEALKIPYDIRVDFEDTTTTTIFAYYKGVKIQGFLQE